MKNKINNIYIFAPTQQDLGIRIDKYISSNVNHLSRTMIKKIIEDGNLYNNDKLIVDCSYIVKNNDNYKLNIPEDKKSDISPNNSIKLDIVFEDDDLIVINKQTGLTTHPGAGNYNDTLVNALMAYSNLSSIGGVERPGIVHRLDKDTSGLMVVAKNDFTHLHLSQQLQTRELKRVYFALVYGVMPNIKGKISTNIARSFRDRTKMTVIKSGGKEAITNYNVCNVYFNQISAVECRLETGRTHQIRVHLTHIGHPLIGDKTYGIGARKSLSNLDEETKKLVLDFNRQFLHAKALGFIHPRNSQYVEFSSELAYDLKELIKELEKMN